MELNINFIYLFGLNSPREVITDAKLILTACNIETVFVVQSSAIVVMLWYVTLCTLLSFTITDAEPGL